MVGRVLLLPALVPRSPNTTCLPGLCPVTSPGARGPGTGQNGHAGNCSPEYWVSRNPRARKKVILAGKKLFNLTFLTFNIWRHSESVHFLQPWRKSNLLNGLDLDLDACGHCRASCFHQPCPSFPSGPALFLERQQTNACLCQLLASSRPMSCPAWAPGGGPSLLVPKLVLGPF